MIKRGETGAVKILMATNWSALLRETKSLGTGVRGMNDRERALVVLGILIGIMISYGAWGLSLLGCALLGWCGAS